jgi:hypothetical protein
MTDATSRAGTVYPSEAFPVFMQNKDTNYPYNIFGILVFKSIYVILCWYLNNLNCFWLVVYQQYLKISDILHIFTQQLQIMSVFLFPTSRAGTVYPSEAFPVFSGVRVSRSI